ncbi:Homeobox protein pknox2 [Mactra antiquata]
MSVVTHVIPQSFSDGQIINIVTPTVGLAQTQDGVTQNSVTAQLVSGGTFAGTTVQTLAIEPAVDKDKQLIYNHPLFPLMALLFERCEQASAATDFPAPEGIVSDIQSFIRHQEKENNALLTGDEDLDQLMIKAIQVLRIHLLELEKVNDLCKDFCQRYTNCLKGKLQSENLLRTESDYDSSMFDEPPKEESVQMTPMSSTPGSGVILQQPFQSTVTPMPTLGPGQIMSGGTIYQMVQTPQGLVAQPLQIQQSMGTTLIHGSTPLSQIGVTAQTTVSSSPSSSGLHSLNNTSSGFDSDDDEPGKKKSKRGVLPKSATHIMRSWLFQHIVHPYPTEDEKRQIANQTNLTLLQVNNWFINARRRILQPMLDAGNPEQAKSKKTKAQTKPPQRFWPFAASTSQNVPTTERSSIDTTTTTSPSTTNLSSLSQTIVIPPGAFLTSDGQIVSLQGANIASMLNHVKQTSPSPTADDNKTFVPPSSDTNNNSHHTDTDSNHENEDLT